MGFVVVRQTGLVGEGGGGVTVVPSRSSARGMSDWSNASFSPCSGVTRLEPLLPTGQRQSRYPLYFVVLKKYVGHFSFAICTAMAFFDCVLHQLNPLKPVLSGE